MSLPIAEYALIGNTRTAALVGRDGSIDWLCLPRFDSAACFASLLGGPEYGRWLIAPAGEIRGIKRRYRHGTLVLETDYETAEGAIRLIDCMPLWPERSDVVRLVKGLSGRVSMRMELRIRFDYGSIVPWVRSLEGGLAATAGPDALEFRTIVDLRGEDFATVADFSVIEGQLIPFVLSYFASHKPPPLPIDPFASVDASTRWWQAWSKHCTYDGPWRDSVLRSVITLKALTFGVERFGLEGPVERWRALRKSIHDQACAQGFDSKLGSFVQSYGSKQLDASLLMIPLVGFLPPRDPRVKGTVEAIERHLLQDGLIRRYASSDEIDGLPPGEGIFLPCSFWLVDNLAMLGRHQDAYLLFERLLSLCNDVGLLSEEYDPNTHSLLGNFPQAISHVALVNSAANLSPAGGPSHHRSTGGKNRVAFQ